MDSSHRHHRHGPRGHARGGHEHGHEHVHRASSRGRLLISMGLTGTMMVVELIGGILSGSLALVSDAGHMFTHFFALGVSYFAIRIAAMPVGPEKSFGLYRTEILAALVNGVFLAGVSVWIAYESVVRFINPQPIAGVEMLVVAGLGLAVNLASAALLWGTGREDLNVRSAFFHMLADTVSSVGVVVGAVVIIATGFLRIDPILSLLITVMIAIWSWQLLSQSCRVLLEAMPKGFDVPKLRQSLVDADPRVRDVHDLHVWEITSGMLAMTAIVEIDAAVTVAELEGIQAKLRAVALERFDIGHAIFEVSSPAEGHAHDHE